PHVVRAGPCVRAGRPFATVRGGCASRAPTMEHARILTDPYATSRVVDAWNAAPIATAPSTSLDVSNRGGYASCVFRLRIALPTSRFAIPETGSARGRESIECPSTVDIDANFLRASACSLTRIGTVS